MVKKRKRPGKDWVAKKPSKQVNENNFAYIDGTNLYLAVTKQLKWRLDYRRFRIFLENKYADKKAYLFLGYMEEHDDLYKNLQEQGYILIFKPTYKDKSGQVKGNCDAELVLQAMIDWRNYDQAVVVTGDGDFYCLIKYLEKMKKLKQLLIPNKARYSCLLNKINRSDRKYVAFLSELKSKLELNKKRAQNE
jgi:uncharacterized LabA/DUF88 family protein